MIAIPMAFGDEEVQEIRLGDVRYAVGDRVRLRAGAGGVPAGRQGVIDRIYSAAAQRATLRVVFDGGDRRLFLAPADVEAI